MVPNAPVRVLIIVPLVVALPAGTIVNAAPHPKASASSAVTAPDLNVNPVVFIGALSSSRSFVERFFNQLWIFVERYGAPTSTPRVSAYQIT
jgi:hypothetical protein